MKIILFGICDKQDFKQLLLNRSRDRIEIIDMASYYDMSNPDYNTKKVISETVKYSDVVFRLDSRIYDEEEIKDKFKAFKITWLTDIDADKKAKILWPNDKVKNIDGEFVNKNFILSKSFDKEIFKKQMLNKVNENSIYQIAWLSVRKLLGLTLTAKQETDLEAFANTNIK